MVLTSNEKSIPSKYRSVITILKVVTDAVLRMTRSMQSSNLDALAYGKNRVVLRSLRNFGTILASNYWDTVVFELPVLIRADTKVYSHELGTTSECL